MVAQLSGKWGVVNGQNQVRDWNITDGHTPQQYVASGTVLGTGAVEGIKDWTGSFNQYLAEPAVLAGDLFNFEGYLGPDDGTASVRDGQTYTGSALALTTTINWNWEGGEILNCSTSFGGNGVLIGPVVGDYTDTSVPDPLTICGTKIEYSDDGLAWTEFEQVSSATLNLECNPQTFVDSSSNCYTGRRSGPLNWNASITFNDSQSPLQKGLSRQWRFYTTATEFWLLKWGIVGGFSNINVDVEGGAIINQTMDLMMDGFADPLDNTGIVTTPGGVNWWSAV